MLNRRIDASKIKLAQIEWFDSAKNDVESFIFDTYVFLYEHKGHYVNPFNAFLELPIYEEVTNSIQSSEETCSSVTLVEGEERDGLCYTIKSNQPKDLLGSDAISAKDLIGYMISSDNYFIDRLPFLLKALNDEEYDPKIIHALVEKIRSDKKHHNELLEFFNSTEKSRQYNKLFV